MGKEHCFDDRGVQKLVLKKMKTDLTTMLITRPVDDPSTPQPSPFLAAGQIFTHGRFCEEVQYDPDLYYAGEEISLSARAYTQGYDFFCPNEDLLWHLYAHSMPVHSADHKSNQHEVAVKRLQALLTGGHAKLGKYGLGNTRSLSDYEALAELNFKAHLNRQPVKTHLKQNLKLDLTDIEPRNDYDLWVFTLLDLNDEEIYRRDLFAGEIPSRENPSLELDITLSDEPVSYALWPHSTKHGFHRRIVADVQFL